MNPKSKRYDSTFPCTVSLGERSVGWYENEVQEWLESLQRKHNSEDGGNMLKKKFPLYGKQIMKLRQSGKMPNRLVKKAAIEMKIANFLLNIFLRS